MPAPPLPLPWPDIWRLVRSRCRGQIRILTRMGWYEEEIEQELAERFLHTQARCPGSAYDPDRGAPSTWVVTVARSRLGHLIKVQRRRLDHLHVGILDDEGVEHDVASTDIEGTAYAPHEYERLIDQATAELPERERVILRRHLDGDTDREIGRDLGVTREWVRQLRGRAVTRLRGGDE